MKKLTTRGFTLIELLVVIAIIGILSSIVLASLSSARDKGTDSAIKADLANMRAQGEIYYSNYNNYGGNTVAVSACPATANGTSTSGLFGIGSAGYGLYDMVAGLKGKTTGSAATCTATVGGRAWAVSAPLKAGGNWCVDNSGRSMSGISAAGVCS